MSRDAKIPLLKSSSRNAAIDRARTQEQPSQQNNYLSMDGSYAEPFYGNKVNIIDEMKIKENPYNYQYKT